MDSDDTSDRLLKLQLRLAQLDLRDRCQEDFLTFVKHAWPEFIAGNHHRIIADKLARVASGDLKRLIINMPPRHTKSEFASFLFPAWFMGKFPNKKIIQATHTTELAVSFGRKTKNLIEREDYADVFSVKLAADSKASGRWDTDRGGMYYAVGVGSNLAGRGGDLIIIDDPHSEQTLMSNTGFDDAWDWYTGGPRQRLQPGGAIIVVMTRWSEKDLTGQLIRAQARDPMADQWEIVELPAIMPSGNACWPEYWSLDNLERVKASIPPSKWNAQYQQNPTGDETSILKREWWRVWEKEKIPPLEYVIQSYDTAFSKRQTADYSAITTWGVFRMDEGGPPGLLLLDAKKGRWDFPELKRVAWENFQFWEPETVIIEAKATGTPLTQELRNMGIPVVNFTPSRGNDKVSRAHSIAPLFEAGMVWAPDEQWAHDVIEECAAFPNGEHDDYVDSCLVGESMVSMSDGSVKRLDSVRPGDHVQTPAGPRKVTRFLDQGVKEVWEMRTDTALIIATGDHLVMSCKGWVRLDSLQSNVDTVTQSDEGVSTWRLSRKQSFLTVGGITSTLKAKIQPIGDTFLGQAAVCIGMFGNSIMALSPRGTMSITSTGTPRTTIFPTFPAFPQKPIEKCTRKMSRKDRKPPSTWRIFRQFAPPPPHGIPPRKGALGTVSTRGPLLRQRERLEVKRVLPKWLLFASGAARKAWDTARNGFFALRVAKPLKANFVQVRSVSNTLTMRRVYDLEVEDQHCFYANGVLVHNCTQAMMRYRQGNFVSLPTDDWAADGEESPRIHAYYG